MTHFAKQPQGKPIRVGFVMHVMQVAGAEVLVTQIIEELAGKIDATVFCLDSLGELGQKLLDKGIPVVVLNRKPGVDFGVAKRLAAEIRNRQIEVLHAHQYTPFFYAALSRLLHRISSAILFTEHGRHYPDIVSMKRRWTNRLLLQHYADISTACCDFSTDALRNIEGFRHAITLPNGVDLKQLSARGDQHKTMQLRDRLNLKRETPYAACVARFHPVKDHETLIKAWRLVHTAIPEAKLLLVGDGECRKQCEQLTQTLGLSECIQFLGIRHDIPAILKAVDVFALTSVSEAASLTLLEAMASGCPSVVTDVGGNGEHVRHGVEGLLAKRGSQKEIASHLISLLSNPTESRRLGKNARDRVLQNFNLQTVIQQYFSYYKGLARSQRTIHQ